MATSNNIGTVETRDEIVEAALRLLGQLGEGESASSQQVMDGQKTLNRMVKAWQNQGIHLWKYAEASLFLQDGQAGYTVGTGATDHCTETYYSTTLSADASSGDSTITVTSDDNISDGDFIGIVLDDSTMQWTTVNGAPVANVVTLTDNLTDDATSGNAIYNYTNKINKPNRILNVRRYDISAEQDVPIMSFGRSEYFSQPNKTNEGLTVNLYYDRQRTNGTIYLWPTPNSDITNLIKFSYQKPFEVFDSSADEADFPQEFLEAMVYGLAVRLSPEYGLDFNERAFLKQEAEQYLNEAKMFDREPESIYMQPNFDGTGYAGNTDGTN